MTLYEGMLVLKFLNVMGFAGGAIAAFMSTDRNTRRRAAHSVASPCMLGTWLCGYALVLLRGWPSFELWIVGALMLSFLATALLAYCVARDRRDLAAFLGVAAPLAVVVGLMVVKPTWARVVP